MIAKQNTPFEQRQALNSAYDMIPSLDLLALGQLEMSITEAIGTSIVNEDSSRWELAHRLLEDLEKRAKMFE
jgi:hypothetical protein